jgi:hypothetical protein
MVLAGASLRAVPLQINGPSSYQLQPDGLTVRITTTFTNTGTTASAALQLQLWAFATPFNPNATPQTGYRLATVNLASLPAGASYAGITPVAVYSPPASGVWNVVLFAEEDTGAAFVIRSFFNFPEPLPVAASMASYAPTAIFGVPVPVTLRNLLVDSSRVYWSQADAGRIDSVGLIPGSQPGALTTYGGGPGNPFTMVQDAINLYVLRQTLAPNAEIFRVTKTTGTSTRIAVVSPALDGPRAGPIGIQPQGGVLYFPAYQNLPANLAFVGTYMSRLSTQGGTITHYGTEPPITAQLARANVSATSIAVDFTSVTWIEGWDRTIRQMPLVGAANSTVLVSDLGAGANFLTAPTHGPAGGNLFWIEGNRPNRALMRRRAGSGQVVRVFGNVASDNYAIDGDRVYLVSGVVDQANGQLCSVSRHGHFERRRNRHRWKRRLLGIDRHRPDHAREEAGSARRGHTTRRAAAAGTERRARGQRAIHRAGEQRRRQPGLVSQWRGDRGCDRFQRRLCSSARGEHRNVHRRHLNACAQQRHRGRYGILLVRVHQ